MCSAKVDCTLLLLLCFAELGDLWAVRAERVAGGRACSRAGGLTAAAVCVVVLLIAVPRLEVFLGLY